MSFLSCIGKRSKKKRGTKNPPHDRIRDKEDNIKRNEFQEEIPDIQKVSPKPVPSPTSSKTSNGSDGKLPNKDQVQKLAKENDKLQEQNDQLEIEIAMYKTQLERYDTDIKTYMEEVRRLERSNLDSKTRLTVAETESAKLTIENQKLLQKIVGMEENQAMMSRAELQSMISQLEEAEQKSSSKPAAELSGIRTNPAEILSRKKMSQEEKQISWRLTNAEARLSQSEDENQRLRNDLKEMLDTHTELQIQFITNTKDDDIAVTRSDVMNEMIDNLTNDCLDSTNRSIHCFEEKASQACEDILGNDTAELNGILERLANAEAEQNRLTSEYSSLEISYNDLVERLAETEQSCQQQQQQQQQQRLQQQQQEQQQNKQTTPICEYNGTFMKRLSEHEEEQITLKSDISSLETACGLLSARIDKLCSENNQFKSKNENLRKQSRNQKNEMEKQVIQLNKLKDENARLSEENKRMNQQQQKRKDTGESRNKIDALQKELAETKKKNEEADKRLKEQALQTAKQPTQFKSLDLISTNPSSLAERFRRELYDQKWMEAFSLLTEKMRKDDKKAAHILSEICTECYLFCKRAARYQLETMTSTLVSPTSNHYRSGQFNKRNTISKALYEQIPDDLKRRLSHFRSRPTEGMINTGVRDFLNQIDYDRTRHLRHISERDLGEIMTYVSTCFEICWCMSVQDPPMYLLFKLKHGVDIDAEKFDRYNTRGRRVDFVVWPAVFGLENGPCLQKGVIQALPDRS